MITEMRFEVFVNRHNDPRKNDWTKQDERDNDHTRIRQEPSPQKHPETPGSPPEEPGTIGPVIPKNKERKEELVSESSSKPFVAEKEKKDSGEAEKNIPHKGNYNAAVHEKNEIDSLERDDEGNAVL
jgi:hypothetical protein